MGLEMLFKEVQLNPYDFFCPPTVARVREKFYWGNVVPAILAELKVNGWNEAEAQKAVDQALKANLRHDIWLYASLAYAHKIGLEETDKYSFASLLTYIITGWYGGFGTENYEKERKIEKRWLFLQNRLIENQCSPATIAKIAIIFLEDQYKTLTPSCL